MALMVNICCKSLRVLKEVYLDGQSLLRYFSDLFSNKLLYLLGDVIEHRDQCGPWSQLVTSLS